MEQRLRIWYAAAGVLPAVEGGIQPPGTRMARAGRPGKCKNLEPNYAHPAGRDARLYGRQDACRHAGRCGLSFSWRS